MAKRDFVDQLIRMGMIPEDLGDNKIAMKYVIPVGKYIGQEIHLGFVVGEDFPHNCPTGPHISPLLISPDGSGVHPNGNISTSPFGSNWQYWSRPFPGWNSLTEKTAKSYMRHIKLLFHTL